MTASVAAAAESGTSSLAGAGGRGEAVRNGLVHAVLWLNTALMLYPILVVALSAFKTSSKSRTPGSSLSAWTLHRCRPPSGPDSGRALRFFPITSDAGLSGSTCLKPQTPCTARTVPSS